MFETLSMELAAPRLLIAAVLGGLLGLEREVHGRAAGFRTHLLLSMGAAVFMLLSPYVATLNVGFFGDPGRIAAQIVTGIGFLGAGAILKEGLTIRGLTTAACLWVAAAIGMSAGAGCYALAALTTGISLAALLVLPHVEHVLKRHSYRVLQVTTPGDVGADRVIAAVRTEKVKVLRCDLERDYEKNTTTTTLLLRLFHRGVTDKVAHGVIRAVEAADVSPRRITWSHL